MKSIDRLREYVKANTNETTALTSYPFQYEVRCTTMVNDLIDAIEREVEEGYVELPRDVNGEHVRIGDTVHDNEEGYDFRVDGFMLLGNATEWWAFQGQVVQQKLKMCSIVKPPTVEDMLEKALNKAACLDHEEGYWPSAADITNIVNEIAPKLQLREE